MAQQAAINIVETCNQLKIGLANIFDRQGETKPAQILIDRLVSKVHRLPNMEITADILRSIFYPFGTRTLHHGSLVCDGK
jgi:hypothetical protein